MEQTESPSVTRVSSSRTLQACQRCRNLKTRCLPSRQSGTCQRCFVAQRECAWADAPRRARKLRAPSRIAQVEQKIDGLVAKLVNAVESDAPPDTNPVVSPQAGRDRRRETCHNRTPMAPGSWMPTPSFESDTTPPDRGIEQAPDGAQADQEYLDSIRNIHDFDDRDDISQTPDGFFRPSNRPEAPIDNDLVKSLLTTGEADALLHEYRQMSATFPFVILPQNITGEALHTNKPMLFLAMLTVASWKEHTRQMKLDAIYRSELANRTIIHPRRTLGLVQSVLVYLSWYHYVFSHKTQQIFFLHHLVIGLALDIGLHQDYQPLNLPMPQRHKPPPPHPQEVRERQRAFLGCYYLASMIAAGLQKPNLLKHTSCMAEWAQSINRAREYESDETISHLVSLRQIDDQIQDTLFTADAMRLPLSDGRTLMHMRFMEAQLDAWKRESHGAASQRLLELSFSFTRLLLNSVALRPHSSNQPSTTDPTQLNALLTALEAGKRFLDTLLSFPANEYHLISFSEWMRLPTVIMTVAKLCMPSDAHSAAGWDVQPAQERVRLDLCLEALCYRMQALSTYDKTTQPHPDFWYAMRFIIDLTKTWYMRKIRPHQPTQTPSEPTPVAHGPSELSCPRSEIPAVRSIHAAGQPYNTVASINYMGDINLEMEVENMDDAGPFDCMKDADFDMEMVFDMGIWGDESYSGLGFGGGAPF
ncbi:hypothetical protein BDW02DRAFT_565259 [Decorospora gaudefroyi]|uniref:Zn(2)-C6 fungal-type domain-containing protein n=1 Tax=Decorospora gaudefroyi TaxID=184978 RepID=A0A6A5KX35_9PLEO|nr:hypothetical protein BDW02DRAFT_565259 [Decorospora gaudefroyi]